ncbi:MAG: hypothetical protein JWO31_4202 [Phycisphaerales bacterium]|nr:hypothetical protein [Phycisphaerales bacterium]
MAQVQNDVSRFAGPSMIQDYHHMAGIPQVQDENARGGRQSEQGQSDQRQQGSTGRVDGQFEYHNPRQYS